MCEQVTNFSCRFSIYL